MATRDELRKEAKELKIKGYSRMKKAELEAAVAAAKAGTVEPLATEKPAVEPVKQEKDRVVIVSDDVKIDDNLVQEIGNGSLENAGVFLLGLKRKSKRTARKFRKQLRKAGFNAAAGVDTRNYEKVAA